MQRLVLACALVGSVAPRTALAEDPAPVPGEPAAQPPSATPPVDDRSATKPASRREIEIEVPGERSRQNKLMVGGMLAAGVIASAIGVYYHLDSRDASDAVGSDEFTGEAWSAEHIAEVDRAESSKTKAIVGYSIGGALLLATVITYIVTEPKTETAVIRTGFAVHEDGAMVTRAWSF